MATTKTTKKLSRVKRPIKAARPLRLEYVQASTLKGNPRNWRRHPETQLDALRSVLKDPEVGWAGAMLFNERTGRLVDGHGRLKVVPPKEFVPVLVGSWTDAAEAKILLTLDPLAALAEASAEALSSLRADVGAGLDDEAFAGLRAELDQVPKDATPPDVPAEKQNSAADGGSLTDQYKLVITCRDESHQAKLLDAIDRADSERLGELLKGADCKALVG